MSTTVKNIFRAFGAASFGQLVNVLGQMLLIPVYIRFWGTELYGEWLILSAAPSIITLAGDLGFGTVAGNEMRIQVVQNDQPAALRVFQNTWIVLSSFSLLILLTGMVLFYLLPVNNILHIHRISYTATFYIIILLLVRILMDQQNALLAAGLRCASGYALSIFISNACRFVEYAVIILFIFLGGVGPVEVAMLSLALSVVQFLVFQILLRIRAPWLHYGFSHFSMETIRTLTPVALSFLAFPVINSISVQGTIGLIGILFGSVEVAVFATTRTLLNTIRQFINIINYSIWNELTSAYGKKNFELARRIFFQAFQFTFLSVMVFLAGALVFGPSVYTWWTKGVIPVNHSFFYLFAVIICLNALWNSITVVQYSTNNARRLAMYNVSALVLCFASIFISYKLIGIYSILLGLLLSELFMIVVVQKDSMRILQCRFQDFMTEFSRFGTLPNKLIKRMKTR